MSENSQTDDQSSPITIMTLSRTMFMDFRREWIFETCGRNSLDKLGSRKPNVLWVVSQAGRDKWPVVS